MVIKVLSDTARQQRLLGDPEHINHPSVCQPPSIIAASPALSSCWSSIHSCLFPSSLFLLAFLKVRAFSNYTAKKKNGAELCLRAANSPCHAVFTSGSKGRKHEEATRHSTRIHFNVNLKAIAGKVLLYHC